MRIKEKPMDTIDHTMTGCIFAFIRDKKRVTKKNIKTSSGLVIQTSLLVFHECTKHIQIDGHFIRQHVQFDTTHLPPCNLGISSPRSMLLLGMAHIMNLREL